MTAMSYYVRMAGLFAVLAVGGIIVACGGTTRSANDTLPPIITTTTTTTLAPTTTTIPQVYVVQKGDSLSGIAKKFGVSAAKLAAFNNITDPDKIQAGQKLNLPQPGDVVVTLAPTTTATPTVTTARPRATVPPATDTAPPATA
jgi:LysM repeat protein